MQEPDGPLRHRIRFCVPEVDTPRFDMGAPIQRLNVVSVPEGWNPCLRESAVKQISLLPATAGDPIVIGSFDVRRQTVCICHLLAKGLLLVGSQRAIKRDSAFACL